MASQSQKLYLLGEEDLAVLRRLIDAEKRRPQNRPGPAEAVSEDNQRSGVFALIPAGGIPARTDNGDGTYTLHGVECQMYKEVWDDQDQRTLEAVDGWEEYVVNHSDSEISAGTLLPTEVTTQGTRFPIVGTAGTAIISFRVLSAGGFIGTVDNYCLRVQAEVIAVSCAGAGVSVGDEITVWDPGGCHFNVPIEVLLNTRGTAIRMAWNDSSDTGTAALSQDLQGIPYCFLQGGDDTYELAGDCWWMVQSLCCLEEWYDEP